MTHGPWVWMTPSPWVWIVIALVLCAVIALVVWRARRPRADEPMPDEPVRYDLAPPETKPMYPSRSAEDVLIHPPPVPQTLPTPPETRTDAPHDSPVNFVAGGRPGRVSSTPPPDFGASHVAPKPNEKRTVRRRHGKKK